MRRVTFSRNYTLSLSRTCQCYCKYCAFATHRAHIHDPDEVERRLEEAVRRNAKELLVLTGERPEGNPEVAERLREWGHEDFTSYVVWACQRALERGLLPHTNLGVLSREDLIRVREVTASQGLMLESINPDLVVHQGSPTKHPAKRLETIRLAGELRIPFTTGILVGIGETPEERVGALEAIAAVHAEYGHVQEVILQNFVPHPRYYGQEVAEIADRGLARALDDRQDPRIRAAPPGLGDPGLDRRHEAADRGVQAADAGRRRPGAAEPRRLVARAGRGRGDRPGRPVEQRRSHLARGAVPEPAPGAQGAGAARLCPHRAPLRLPAIPRPRVDGAGRPGRREAQVLELHPEARLRPTPGDSAGARGGASRHREGPARGGAQRGGADGPLLGDPARGDRGDAGRGGRAARRAGGGGGDLRRQPEHQLHERLRGRLRLLRVRPGQALAGRLSRQRGGLCGTRRGGDRLRRDRDLHAGRDPPRLHARGLRPLAALREGVRSRTSTCTPTRRWRSTTCASGPGAHPTRCSST